MNFTNILVGICSVLFFMIGADKFFPFMQPPCSMMDGIRPFVWKILGVLQIAGGILIWLPSFRKYVAGFFIGFMLTFTTLHLTKGTYDVGGAVFMAVLLAFLVWNPSFLGGKKAELNS